MSESQRPEVGSIGWIDLTVPEAESARAFYSKVVGWKSETADMGGYSDFTMIGPESGEPRTGICHARGANEDLPGVWTIYIVVADVKASLKACREGGGTVVKATREMAGTGRYALIRDPTGAVCALFEPA